MKIKRNLIASIVLSTLIILTLVCVSGIGRGECTVANLNGPSASVPSIEPLVNPASVLQLEPMSNTPSLSTAVISAVQSGTASTSTITLGPSPNPVGTNVSVDIRIDDVAVGFWGWEIPTVTWNHKVMNLTQVQQGPFLSANTGGDTTDFVGSASQLWDNTKGTLGGGLAEGILGVDTSTDASGVLATLTFLVTGSGSSTINIVGGNLIPNSSDSSSVNVTCNDATIVVHSTNPSAPEFPLGIIVPIILMIITIFAVPAIIWSKKNRNEASNRLNALSKRYGII